MNVNEVLEHLLIMGEPGSGRASCPGPQRCARLLRKLLAAKRARIAREPVTITLEPSRYRDLSDKTHHP
jgi:hypothetical protein